MNFPNVFSILPKRKIQECGNDLSVFNQDIKA